MYRVTNFSWALVLCLGISSLLINNVHGASKSIPSYLSSTSKFSRLNSLLKKAKLDKSFTSSSTVTLFAPSNSAISKSLFNTLNALPVDDLARILKYHVVPGVLTASTLTSISGVSLRTLIFGLRAQSSQYSTLIPDAVASPGSVIIRGLYTAGKVVTANIKAGDSIIHEVDAVLRFTPPSTPKYQNIDEAILKKGGLTVFSNSLAKYFGCDDCYPRSLLNPFGIESGDIPGTVFAISDAGFAKWAKENSCSNTSVLPIGGIVAYSFTFDLLPPARLAADAFIETLNHYSEDASVGPPQLLQVKYVKGKRVIWAQPGRVNRTPFFQANIVESIVTTSGVLHIVDNVLYPLNGSEDIC